MLTARILRNTLIEVRDEFLDDEYETTWDINNGGCEDYAVEVFERLGGESDNFYGCWLEDLAPDGPNHYAIFWKDRWYDAECIDGVKDWRDLPITLNRGKTRDEVLAERAREAA